MAALPKDGLPPGPWAVEEHANHDTVILDTGGGSIVIEVGRFVKGAGPAIAALPERIAREDRVREFCVEVITAAGFPRLGGREAPEATVARQILRILDGEEAA